MRKPSLSLFFSLFFGHLIGKHGQLTTEKKAATDDGQAGHERRSKIPDGRCLRSRIGPSREAEQPSSASLGIDPIQAGGRPAWGELAIRGQELAIRGDPI
jgi:hypothetical protein